MSVDIKRALTDNAYRATLTKEELALLPKEATAERELSEEELQHVGGVMANIKHPD